MDKLIKVLKGGAGSGNFGHGGRPGKTGGSAPGKGGGGRILPSRDEAVRVIGDTPQEAILNKLSEKYPYVGSSNWKISPYIGERDNIRVLHVMSNGSLYAHPDGKVRTNVPHGRDILSADEIVPYRPEWKFTVRLDTNGKPESMIQAAGSELTLLDDAYDS